MSKVEAYFLDQISKREILAKKLQCLATTSNAAGTRLISTAVITGSHSIPAFASGWALPIGVYLSDTGILLPLANATSQKSSQLFAAKQEKHNLIRLLAQTKLDSFSDAISQSIQDENISPAEFHKTLQKMEKYYKLKEEIRR